MRGRRLSPYACAFVVACMSFVLLGTARSAELPDRLGLGAYLPVDEITSGWFEATQVPWDYTLTGVSGGANKPKQNWTSFNPDATYPLLYARASDDAGAVPVFVYYNLAESDGPCSDCDDGERNIRNLNSTVVMRAWYENFRTLLQRLGPRTVDGVKGFGKTAIIAVEPALGGLAQAAALDGANCFGHCVGQTNDPDVVKAAVSSTKLSELDGLPDTFHGFVRAVVRLRDRYAPNVDLSYGASHWSHGPDIALDPVAELDASDEGTETGAFVKAALEPFDRERGSTFELVSLQLAYGDAGWHKYEAKDGEQFWDRTGKTFPNADRYATFLAGLSSSTRLPVILHDIPVGNQVYRSMNNTTGHYQDDKAELIFENVGKFRDAGVRALIFGQDPPGTSMFDARRDGITDSDPVCTSDGGGTRICPSLKARFPDDDGGFLRTKAREYYQDPLAVSLPTTTTAGGAATTTLPLVLGGIAFLVVGTGAVLFARRRKRGATSAAVPAAAPSDERYELRRLVGEGATKSVYLARDNVLERDVALALVKTASPNTATLERLKREALALAQLGDHPNIVPVYDAGERDGKPFIVSQYLPGGSVLDLVENRAGPIPLRRCAQIGAEVARALAYAHGNGIVHRDVKPANVWLAVDGTAKLGDFGLAANDAATKMTQPGTVLGTIASMAPEQARGEDATPASDIYSLGVLLYELVCGVPPFTGETIAALVSQHLTSEPEPPSTKRPGLPDEIDALIVRCLAKDPANRPAGATDVADALTALIGPAPSTSMELVAASVIAEKPNVSELIAKDGTVTLCFTDIERSTELTEELGDHRWVEVLGRHNRVVREHVKKHRGKEVSSQGDGFLLAFSSPIDAVSSAIAVERALDHMFSDPDQPPIRVRIGIHTGEAITAEDNFYGRHVNFAARIGAQADGGEVLVSEATYERVRSERFAIGEGREVRLKGVSGTHVAYPVDWRS